MKKIYLILAGVIGLSALVTVITVTLTPKVLPVIKPSQIHSPAQLGKAISERMRDELRVNSVVWLGVMAENPEHYAIWKEFLNDLTEPGLKFDFVVAAQELQNTPEGMVTEKVDVRGNIEGFAKGLETAKLLGKRVAVLMPAEYSTRTIESSVARVFFEKFKLKPLLLSVYTYPRDLEEARVSPIPCATTNDNTGNGELGCELQLKGRLLAKKQKDRSLYFAAMDLVGEKDYHIYFAAPKK